MILTLGGLTAVLHEQLSYCYISLPGVVARSGAHPPGMGRSRIRSSRPANILGRRLVMKVFLSLPLIQEGQLSVTGERTCTNGTGKLPRRLAREQCG